MAGAAVPAPCAISAACARQPGGQCALTPAISAALLPEGWLSNVLNPKTAVFYLAFLPQFTRPTEPVLAKTLLLAGIHFVEAIAWLVALSIVLDHTRRFIVKSAVRRGLEGLCGAMLVGFGARLALARR